ncbi:hypothetical protein HMI54_006690 [Coelomomyces lativittatus]|nr:hypothetical protein HMI56_001884 [Coelomomyces lativittatus]KAJ1517171.1 hypothetical protein HMI54_006690 [Coelomomyces lativittatus]KAJ1518073.1 hypothetical protein HMI55_003288 [Coelomomyces lativittatus]
MFSKYPLWNQHVLWNLKTSSLGFFFPWKHIQRTFSSTGVSFKNVPFTSFTYPKLYRHPSYKKLSNADVQFFESLLGRKDVLYHPNEPLHDELRNYNVDWMQKFRGQSCLVLRPSTTEQVAQILTYCHTEKLAVVPQGGNTGLVGGSVPVFDEVVLSLSKLNQILHFDPYSGVLTAQAGCILETLDQYLANHGHQMPLDLGAKGSCQLGGNLATNAGGLRLLKYGSLLGNTLGMECVLPNGHILNQLSGLRKNNTGYNLPQLMIGSEGTLGVITAASLITPVRPKVAQLALVGVPTFDDVKQVFVMAREVLGSSLSAFEFWDTASNTLLMQCYPSLRHPLPTYPGFFCLVESSGMDEAYLAQLLDTFLERSQVTEGALAQDIEHYHQFWKLRETIPEASTQLGAVYKYDVSLPVSHLYALVEAVRARLQQHHVTATVLGYGHFGDNNIHVNVATPSSSSSSMSMSMSMLALLEPFIYEYVSAHQGSISAEHGLGLVKCNYLHYSKSPLVIQQMHQLKQLFDPHYILNPYKYLPEIQ